MRQVASVLSNSAVSSVISAIGGASVAAKKSKSAGPARQTTLSPEGFREPFNIEDVEPDHRI